MTKYTLHLRDNLFDYCQGMAIIKEVDGKKFVGKLIFEELEPGSFITPTFEVNHDHNILEQMRNELRRLGLLENADQATVGALTYHLEDMRRLVFGDKSTKGCGSNCKCK